MDDSSALITITVLLSNVSAHSLISEWLQLIGYKDRCLSSVETEERINNHPNVMFVKKY